MNISTDGRPNYRKDCFRRPSGHQIWPGDGIRYLVHHTYSSYHTNRMEEASGEECYRSINHSERMMQKIEKYAHSRQLCDVTLVVGEERIPAHKLVLCAASDYFTAMFMSEVLEANQNEVVLRDMCASTVVLLVDYMYTGEIELKVDMVESILSTAVFFQLSEVVEACCGYMMKQLHPSNCIGIRHFADTQGCTDLYKVANNYVMENFPDVIEQTEYLQLPTNEVAKLLTSDDLNVPEEEMTFQALVKWAKHDPGGRRKGLAKLLNFVKLPLMAPQFIADHVETNPLFKDDRECQELIMEALKYHLLPERRTSLQSPRTRPRKSTVGVLYAVGGMDCVKGATSIERYCLRTNTWTQVASMNGRRLQFGVAVLEDKLYVVGGRDGLKTMNSVECYDPKKKKVPTATLR